MLAKATAASSQLKSIASDIEGSLAIVATSTADALQNGIHSSRDMLLSTAGEVVAQIRSVTTDAERSVSASANVLGLTLSGKAEEIVGAMKGFERAEAYLCGPGPFKTLVERTLVDAGLATYKAKIKYNRTRPFVAANDNTTCYPKDEEMLRKDGSYPSGHSAYGWAWALILAEMVPDKADAIIQRGYQFGQNRIICGVHWQSDVNAGRVVAAAVVAQLHTNADFKAQFGAAQKEVQAALANNPTPDCALEQAAAAR